MTIEIRPVDRSPAAILARLQAVAHISMNGDGDNIGGKYYGTVVEVGNNELKLWHCDSLDVERVMPSPNELIRYGEKDITTEEFFGDYYPCSQHWQSRGDYDMADFIINARDDIAALLKLLGMEPPEIKPREW